MQGNRPRSIFIVGMACSIVGGFKLAICTFSTFFYLIVHRVIPLGDGKVTLRDPSYDAPGYAVFELVALASAWVLTIVLVWAGEGLVRMRRHGRKAAVWYAVGSIGRAAVVLVYTLAALLPAYLIQGADAGELVKLIGPPIFEALFAAVVWVTATRPAAIAAWGG